MRTNIYSEKIIKLLTKYHLLSLDDINQRVEADYSTVFRNVEKLVKEGKLKKVFVSKKVFYELSFHNHGHFVCNDCGLIESINTKKLLDFPTKKVSDVTISGWCDKCI